MLEGRVKLGAVTLNEMREALGLDPFANAAADRPMVLTATGYVPIEAGVEGQASGGQSAEDRTASGAPGPFSKASPDDPEHPGWPAGTPGGVGGQFRPKDTDAAASGARNAVGDTSTSGEQYAALDSDTRTDATANGRPETTEPGANGSADSDPRNSHVMLAGAGDIVTPRGLIIAPAPASLDPQGLNGPLSLSEQEKIAAALSLIFGGDEIALNPHLYKNLPHNITGAVLPPGSPSGYVAYDVPGLDTGEGPRGLSRLVIDRGTRAVYYTNNHYMSFYTVDIVQPGD